MVIFPFFWASAIAASKAWALATRWNCSPCGAAAVVDGAARKCAKGCNNDCPPDAAPINAIKASIEAPTAIARAAPKPNSPAHTNSHSAHSSRCSVVGMTGETIQIATANSIMPNTCFTYSIHMPARGNKLPADNPTSNSGTLMPIAIENSAAPPKITSLVWLI